MHKKIIISAYCHEILPDTLRDHGYEVHYLPNLGYEELLDQIHKLHGLVVTTKLFLGPELLERAVNMKWIARQGSGMEHIDTAFAESRGIRCINSPEGNRNAVAEHSLGTLLGLTKRIHSSCNEIKDGKWIRMANAGEELSGKTVGIIGYGNTGSAFAKLLQGFGVRILAHDKYKAGFSNHFVNEASLEELLAQSDVVSLHLPLTAETEMYANATFFQSIAKRPYFLSACRGKVTDTHALLHALDNGAVRGAGLDVLENEDLDTYTPAEQETLNRLLAKPNVIITPHIAGYSVDAFYKMAAVILEKLGLRINK